MNVERYIADQKYVLPDELGVKFDDLVELMMTVDGNAFYDLAKEFDELFGEYECPKSQSCSQKKKRNS